MVGAGGSEGGFWRFIIGLVMMIGGGYLFFNSIHVSSGFGFRTAIYSVGGFNMTSGLIMIPFIFGIGIIFYSAKNPIGWVLAVGSLVALGFGVIQNIQFSFRRMTAMDLIIILVLFIGGIGLWLSSLRDLSRRE